MRWKFWQKKPIDKTKVITSWWQRDKKNLINPKTICDLRGHDWEYFDSGVILGRCRRPECKKEIVR